MAKELSTSGLTHNSISTGTVIKGNISASSDIRIDGTLEGDLDCRGKLILGEKGVITGNVTAVNAEIMGSVTGNITAEETLVLKATSLLAGDIEVSSLVIEPNARLNGKCSMRSFSR